MASLSTPKNPLKKKGESVASLLGRDFGTIKKVLPYYSLFEAGIMAYHGLQDVLGVEEWRKRTDMPGSEELAAHFQKGKPVTVIERQKLNKIMEKIKQRGHREGSVAILRDELGGERYRQNVNRASKALDDFKDSMLRQYAPTAWRIRELHNIRESMDVREATIGEAPLNRDAVTQELRRLESLPSESESRLKIFRQMSPAEKEHQNRLQTGLRSVEAHLSAAIAGTTKGGTLDLEEWYQQINKLTNHPFMLQGRGMYMKRVLEEERALAESAGGYPAYPYGRKSVDFDVINREEWRSITVAEYTDAIRNPDTDPAVRAQLEEEIRSSERWVRGRPRRDRDWGDIAVQEDAEREAEELYGSRTEEEDPLFSRRQDQLEQDRQEYFEEMDLADQNAMEEEMAQFDQRAADFLGYDPTRRRANRRVDPYMRRHGEERRGLHGGRRYGQDYTNVERPPPDDDTIPF